MHRRKFTLAAGASLLTAAACPQAWGQTWPSRPIKLVVPFPPGGPTDIMGRVIGNELSQSLGQPVIVDNRAGAGGIIGAGIVASSPADGYTLLLGAGSTIAMAPFLRKDLPYKPSDFDPVGLLSEAPLMVVVNLSVPAKTLEEFIVYAKANPGKLSYGSAGVGNILHISAEWFKSLTNTDLVHVPYKGGAPAVLDLVAGRIEVMFDVYADFRNEIPTGKVRVLAVASTKHYRLLPDVPTAAEAGLPGFDASAWFGLFAPKGTPPQAISRLNAAMQKALATNDVKDMLANLLFEPGGGSPERLAALVDTEISKWSNLIRVAGITPQ